jgi:DNA ligase-associated metallophosphoesterase
MKIQVAGDEMILHPDRAMFWECQETLVVTDLHLGKVQHFRNAGIYVPENASLDNYERLSSLLIEFNPRRLLILGDLFHSSYNQDWINFCELRNSFSTVVFELVPGNHDILDHELFIRNDVSLYPEGLQRGAFCFSHYPAPNDRMYNLAGHVHPGVRLVGDGMPSMKLPVFYFGLNSGILPSFGTFTGIAVIKPQPGDQVIGISEDQLFALGAS